jgi:hypothetical protein
MPTRNLLSPRSRLRIVGGTVYHGLTPMATCYRPLRGLRTVGEHASKNIIYRNGPCRGSRPNASHSPRRGRQRVASGEEASETRRNPRYRTTAKMAEQHAFHHDGCPPRPNRSAESITRPECRQETCCRRVRGSESWGGRLPWAHAHGYLLPPAPRAESPSAATRGHIAPRNSIPGPECLQTPTCYRPLRGLRTHRPPLAEDGTLRGLRTMGEHASKNIIYRNGPCRGSRPNASHSPRRGRQRVASGEEASINQSQPRMDTDSRPWAAMLPRIDTDDRGQPRHVAWAPGPCKNVKSARRPAEAKPNLVIECRNRPTSPRRARLRPECVQLWGRMPANNLLPPAPRAMPSQFSPAKPPERGP